MKTDSPRQGKTIDSDVLQTRLELIHQPQRLHTAVNHSKAIESHHSSLITKPKVKHLHGLNKDQHTYFPSRVQSIFIPFPFPLNPRPAITLYSTCTSHATCSLQPLARLSRVANPHTGNCMNMYWYCRYMYSSLYSGTESGPWTVPEALGIRKSGLIELSSLDRVVSCLIESECTPPYFCLLIRVALSCPLLSLSGAWIVMVERRGSCIKAQKERRLRLVRFAS